MSARSKTRALLPTAGVVAAVATAVSGWAPIARSAPEAGTRDAGVRASAQDAVDGTYESCAAYFGFGKEEFGVLDVVEFDVADQNGADGADHAVPDDTEVVLVLTNEDGDTLECVPEEVSEEAWDAAMDDIDLFIPEEGHQLPAWPGPGHYAYPSVSFEPFVDEFGEIVDVGFRVTSVPDGHTLVSPDAVEPLVQHFLNEYDTFFLYEVDPRVQALIEDAAGAAAADAFAEALGLCDGSAEDVTFGPELVAAVNVLNAFRGFEDQTAENLSCFDVISRNGDVSLLLGLDETVTYVEPIVLALPEEPTTTTSTTPPSTTTTTPPVAESAGATPVVGSPTYTG